LTSTGSAKSKLGFWPELDRAEVKNSSSAEENQWNISKPKRSNKKPWALDRATKQKLIWLEPKSKQAGGRGTDAQRSKN
jgi:hypothetical protein